MTNLVEMVAAQGKQAESTFVKDLVSRDTWSGAAFYGVLFLTAAWLVGRAVNLAVLRLMKRDTRGALDQTTIRFLARLARLFLRSGFLDQLRAAESPAVAYQVIQAAEAELL